MSNYVLPTIGSNGYFELQPPFDSLVVKGARYTCQAIRNINDYLANSEDPKNEIYKSYGIDETDWDTDMKVNMPIVSLQSDKGHWLYIPAKFIISYPITNGIPYRTLMIGVALPSIPVTQDLSHVETDIANLITDYLGITPVIKQVETSQVVLVTKEKHDTLLANRQQLADGRTTDSARYNDLKIKHQDALDKITELQNYIIANML